MQENPFLSKTQSEKYCMSITKEQAELLTGAALLIFNKADVYPTEEEATPIMRIVLKRIEAHNLPIKFTLSGLLVIESLAEGNPGKAVIMLIDCLTKFNGKDNVNVNDLVDVYPLGFYKDEVFADYIDNYLKPRKVEWSWLY